MKCYSILLLLSLSLCVYCEEGKSKPIQLKVSVHESCNTAFQTFFDNYRKVSTLPFQVDIQSDPFADSVTKLRTKEVDISILDAPLCASLQQEVEKDLEVIQIPIITGGVAIVKHGDLNINDIKPDQLCDIVRGSLTEWSKIDAFADGNITMFYLDFESGSNMDLLSFLKYNSKCDDLEPSRTFIKKDHLKPVKSYEEMVKRVAETPGSMGYSWFSATRNQKTFQIWVDRANSYVLPTKTSLTYSLMQLENKPVARQWNDFTLTDMNRMPLDQSCMAMPPYPISRFLFLVIRKDLSDDTGLLMASFINWLSREDTSASATYGKYNHLSSIANTVMQSNLELSQDLAQGRKLAYTQVKSVPRAPKAHGHNETESFSPSTNSLVILSTLTMFSGLIVVAIVFVARRNFSRNPPTEFSIL